MANKWTRQNEHMSNTDRVKHESISSFIKEHVQPILDGWEKDIKNFIISNPKPAPDQRMMVLTIVSRMAEQTKQLQSTYGVYVYTTGYKELPKETRFSQHMLTMTNEWKRDCKHIEKTHSAKHNEKPDQTLGLATLFCEMQVQIQYWMEHLTPSKTKQQQQGTSVAQHGGTDGQQPRHHPQNVPPTTDARQTPSKRPPDGSLTTDERQKLQDEISNLGMKYDSKVAENLEYQKQESQHAADMDKLKKEIERQREELNKQAMANCKVTREKDEALNRLSEIAGQKLRQNNPAITDLSTDNRPTKIAERFKELYANQWTDAFTELTSDHSCSEIKAIDILLGSLDESFDFTASISENQLQRLEHSTQMLTNIEKTDTHGAVMQNRQVDLAKTLPAKSGNRDQTQLQSEHTGDKMQPVPLSPECADLLRQVLKASAPALLPEVQQHFLRDRQAKVKIPEGKRGNAMIEFYKECAAITWYMNVQTPRLYLAPKPTTGTPVQTDLYSLYTQSGEKVDYVVWPACLLHENGPLLAKGILQPFKMERKGGAKEEKKNVASNGRSETQEKGSGSDGKSIIDQNNVNTSSGRKSSTGGNVKNTHF
ncbi:uncharacterized protein LOC110457213 [Mizuhopecten yessoensis]|uniref:uncharacterized protein LOC110457213 n=1 Tax=Mizuhopecten yessoensis TaxID=6573 RepID=UPI000B45E07A|nr:uncharacterized protein LOC110457213 [Mizuhopecten yessoensis]XP_021364059.1 uncharacterized protein LOC110457213 [Mizuhopecten yessoensis]XP_021364060.1 uncharacterized protein LOC110457213 [Mizuhopecten yessoensis]